jgi:sigma-B regulation protein RsbU (phosphoserine phosphatase)
MLLERNNNAVNDGEASGISQPRNGKAEVNQNNQKKTVLLVDDAPSNIQAANSILKDTYKVRIATSGAKALDLVKVAPYPDLILLDVLMPGMDGYEVCARLKSDPETRDIPVIFLTAQTDIEDETHGFEVGAVDYIHKPFSPAVMKVRVQTHLVLRSTRAGQLGIRSPLDKRRWHDHVW